MCGILGVISESSSYNTSFIEKGLKLLAHRGPDGEGIWKSDDGKVLLGHRRLSIIDLSNSGHQPMLGKKKDNVIIFNGEIYNFQFLKNILISKGYFFHSSSDTEVLLHSYSEWGYECLDKIEGMFSFAIYDLNKNEIFCARDVSGQKPFFYSINEKYFKFSSELRPILSDPFQKKFIDYDYFESYLTLGYTPKDKTLLKNIYKLPPANAIIYNLNTLKIRKWQYWSLPLKKKYKNKENISEDLEKEFDIIMSKAVESHMISDVPIGVLLSGGIDSSLITHYAAQKTDKLKTFSVTMKSFHNNDERKQSRFIANYYDTDHTEIDIGDISPSIIIDQINQFDEPIADSSIIPTFILSNLVKKHCSVVLGGDGGDELFGGYKHYNRILWLKKYISWMPIELRKCSKILSSKLPLGFKGKNWIEAISCNYENSLPHIGILFDKQSRISLLKNSKHKFNHMDSWNGMIPKSDDILDRFLRMDFNNYLAEDILVKLDRSSMLNSLEIRSPFLDKKIIEFAFSKVPSVLKANKSERKIFLKNICKKKLPVNFDLKRKQGFSIPLNLWLKEGPIRDYFESILYDNLCIFNKQVISKLFKGIDKGYNNGERLFSLVVFEIWKKKYLVNFF